MNQVVIQPCDGSDAPRTCARRTLRYPAFGVLPELVSMTRKALTAVFDLSISSVRGTGHLVAAEKHLFIALLGFATAIVIG